MEEKSILNIIQKVKQGETQAFNEIILLYEKQVFNLAFRIIKNREDAEEVAQDSFVKAYRRMKSFKGNSKFSTWLYRITYNNSLNKISANKRLGFSEELDDDKLDSSINNHGMKDLLDAERKDFIQKALTKMSPQENTLLTLYYQNECELKEIEEITGINRNTVKVQLHRARKRLEGHLQQMLKYEIESIR
ncbi:sigma-70 family RNA polymerase sigma factor [Marivirga salinae]|uniref:RNA polymerase sigma factor n=1 Tax=Marivirga salinarum TaxID=3059078 RepID=A0AA51NA56_9BACT|nr:sigma-70 family RNA polymerase sigma factor [Marivirga sp. BDSF4-3]WMN11524.1 sigma-70 family RNA polymerase sigma factor [Marivirga sp. BDSF4-3]